MLKAEREECARLRAEAKNAGRTTYRTGHACKHGHVAERWTANGSCAECLAQPDVRATAVRRTKEWVAALPDAERKAKQNARAKQQRNKDREAALERERSARAAADPAVLAARRKSWRERNQERTREYDNAYKAAWRAANPEAAKIKGVSAQARRRALKMNAEGSFTADDIAALLASQGGKCSGCGYLFAGDYHIDHKTPLSRGGTNWPHNLQLLCKSCNSRKWARTMDEWQAHRQTGNTTCPG